MRLYKIGLIAGLALAAVPAGALAAKPSHPVTPASTNANNHTAKVQFVFHGSLSTYTAANGATNGTISLMVKSSNRGPATLKGTTLVFVVTSDTKIVLHAGKPIGDGDKGIVKFRAAKSTSTFSGLTASQVIDQGAAPAAG